MSTKTDGSRALVPLGAARQRRRERGELRRVVRLLVDFSGGRRLYLLGLGMLVIEAVTAVFQAYPLAFLIDFLRDDRTGLGFDVPFLTSPRDETVAVLTAGLVVLTVANSLADSMAEIYLARGGRVLGYNTREALFAKLQRLSLAFHDQRRTGDMLTRVTSDVTAMEEFVVKSFSDLAGSFLVLSGTLVFLLVQSWQVAIIAVLIVPVLSLVSNYFSRRIRSASKRQRAHEGDVASAAQEMLTSIRVVQTYGRSTYEERRFGDQSRKSMEAALDTAVLQAKFSWVVAVLEALVTTVVIWVGLWLIDRDGLTIGTLVLFVLLIENMFKPTRKIIREWSRIGKVYAAAERIAEVLDRELTVKDCPDAAEAPAFAGAIRFRNVSFAYQLDAEDAASNGDNGRRVALDDVSFQIAPGEVLALVGHSGAGKSTLAQLIPRLYDPDEGVVLIDGVDIRHYTLASLRAQISVVLQDTVLFSGSVAQNIAYGRDDATREQVVDAARRANAHDFIAELPEGYDTMLGERAANLSGGQRQRIAIARAFIRNTPILILDEPTTGLDPLAAGLVLRGLSSLIEGKTTLIISHNLSLIRGADRVFVVDGGRVVQSGTPEELRARPGPYAEFEHNDGSAGSPRPAEEVANGAAAGANGHGANGHGANGHGANGDGANGHGAEVGANGHGAEVQSGTDLSPVAAVGGGGQAVGTLAVRSPAPPETWPADHDPIATRAMYRTLPGLSIALDPVAMAQRLQVCVFGRDSHSPVVEQCEVGKAMYLGTEGCRLRYEVSLRDPRSGTRRQALVLARVAPTEEQAATHLATLDPLVAELDGRPEVAGLHHPAALMPDLATVVHVFPVDDDLPALVAATDPRRMAGELAEALGRGAPGDPWRIDVGHYGRRHRCVLRYELPRRRGGPDGPTVVYGKVCENGNGQLVSGEMTRLQAELERSSVRIPSLLAFRPQLGLTLLGELPGTPILSDLRRSRELDAARVEAEVGRAGRVAAALHQVPWPEARGRTVTDEIAGLRAELDAMAPVSPVLAARLDVILDGVETASTATSPFPPGLAHGDYTFAQLLDDGTCLGLLDFDSLGPAEPALDLGHFVAYLRLAGAKTMGAQGGSGMVDRWAERFLDEYVAARPEEMADRSELDRRVQLYEAISLVRITVHSWQKLKGSRVRLSLSLLEEVAPRLN